jgi:hypothetical protein
VFFVTAAAMTWAKSSAALQLLPVLSAITTKPRILPSALTALLMPASSWGFHFLSWRHDLFSYCLLSDIHSPDRYRVPSFS